MPPAPAAPRLDRAIAVLGVLAALAMVEWLRRPAPLAAALALVLVGALLVVLRPWRPWRVRVVAALLVALAAMVGWTQHRLGRLEGRWEEERERVVRSASRQLADDLRAAFRRAERIAGAAAAARLEEQGDAFDRLQGIIGRGADRRAAWRDVLAADGMAQRGRRLRRFVDAFTGPDAEVGVVVFEPDGSPWAWAGRHRVPPIARGDSIGSRVTPYSLVLESRRQRADGRLVVASVLIWAHPAVPERSGAVAELFRRRTGVGLEVFAPGTAPDSSDVFDYAEPTTAGPRLLFSVLEVPPAQAEALEATQRTGRRVALLLLVAALVVGLGTAPRLLHRALLLPLGVWIAARAPVGAALGLEAPFSPATFFLPVPLLGGTLSAAVVLAVGAASLILAAWRREDASAPGVRAGVAGLALVLGAPAVAVLLARGITVPEGGASWLLWMGWQAAVFLLPAGLALAGLSVLPRTPRRRADLVVAGGAALVALALAVAVVRRWVPGTPPAPVAALWVLPLGLLAFGAAGWPRRVAVGIVLGSLAAAVTWSVDAAARASAAEADLDGLDAPADALVVPLASRLRDEIVATPDLDSGAKLFAVWRRSVLRAQRYPVRLGLWHPEGGAAADLPLDSLDVTIGEIASLAAAARAAGADTLEVAVRRRGLHVLLAVPLPGGRVATAVVGPRTALVEATRLGRLLDPGAALPRSYRLSLTGGRGHAHDGWRREGWTLHLERRLRAAGPDGAVAAHATLDLRGPGPLLVRGGLVVLADTALVALCWMLGVLLRRQPPVLGPARRVTSAFATRLALALALFFLLPSAAFAVWGLLRLAEDARHSRDLLIAQELRDAVAAQGGLADSLPGTAADLRALSDRVDVDLALYQGGVLREVSSPILRDLGAVGELVPPEAFVALVLEGAPERVEPGPMPSLAERVGYRVLHEASPAEVAIVATPQPEADTALVQEQADLAMSLLLATLLGSAAALVAARRAARVLAQPVDALRRAALAVGRGERPTEVAGAGLAEFEPVVAAFLRMAADVEAGREALDAARRRTATVLGTVATGVVALDPAGRVLLANGRAAELLGRPLAEGEPLLDRLPPEWAPLRELVERARRQGGDEAGGEVSAGARRVSVRVTVPGAGLPGLVLALNDVTELAEAERVLAWGEMARQVAHEIKNPLTPLRLGMQHLVRAWRAGRGDFDRTLEDTSKLVLGEIERLDTVARAFSRFAAPGEGSRPPEPIDVAAVCREVVQLYGLAPDGVRVEQGGATSARGLARRDELKEVLVNLVENARAAAATRVTLELAPGRLAVRDDGTGIPPEVLPRIFEPRFSTTTSGSGLGLAIVRRLVEGWGGSVAVESEVGRGTTVTLGFRAAAGGD